MKIQIEWKDYLKATLLHHKPTLFLQIYFMVVTIIFFGGMVLFLANFFNFLILIVLIVGLSFVIGYRYLWLPYRIRKLFGQQKGIQKPTEIEIKEEGLKHTQDNGQVLIPWEEILGWRENEEIFMFYLSDAMFMIYPKRFFPDVGVLTGLKEKFLSVGLMEYKKPANRAYTISAVLITLLLMIPACQITVMVIRDLSAL